MGSAMMVHGRWRNDSAGMTLQRPAAHTTFPARVPRVVWVLRSWCVSIITIMVVLALGTGVAGAQGVATADESQAV